MIRVNIYIPEDHDQQLRQLAAHRGIKYSEMVRRILSDALVGPSIPTNPYPTATNHVTVTPSTGA